MAESFIKRLLGYKRHLKRHSKKMAQGEEDAAAALSGVAKETGRFVKHLVKPKATRNHKAAILQVKKGIEYYNASDYPRAERYFKKALAEDPNYARAYTYLGNTYYKLEKNVEAGEAWCRAVQADPKSDAAKKAREKIKATGHGEVDVVYSQKQYLKR